jgi:CTP synthase
MFSNVPMRRVFSMHDRESIYSIPEAMRAEGLDREVLSILNLHDRVDIRREDRAREHWKEYATKILARRRHSISLGIMGKYAALRDAYASIDKAIEHASTHLSANVAVHWIDTSDITRANVSDRLAEHAIDAMIIPGGFGDRGVEGKVAAVEYARTGKIPFLGICLGFQVAVVEYARHVLELAGADSTEFGADPAEPVISELPEQKKIEGLGGTMRLGAQDILIEPDTLASWLYDGRKMIRERFRHRFEVDPAYIDRLTAAGLVFSGRHPDHPIMQVLELPQSMHPYFVAGQFHPELTSRPLSPQPMFMGLIAAGIAHASPDLPREKISERWLREAPANPPQADKATVEVAVKPSQKSPPAVRQ